MTRQPLDDVQTVHYAEPTPAPAAVSPPEWMPEISLGTPTVLVSNHDGSAAEPTTPKE